MSAGQKHREHINPQYSEHLNHATFLTTHVENLHAVSHFKHETFSVLQYAQDFGTIVKESLKRTTFFSQESISHMTDRITLFRRTPCLYLNYL